MKDGDTFWLHICPHKPERREYIPAGVTCKLCDWHELPDIEKVKMDDWMDYNPKNPEKQTLELVKLLQKKYKLLKVNKFASGASFIFTGNKNNPRSEFNISYTTGGIGGGYISYDGVKGQ